jgi:hypothetical protein
MRQIREAPPGLPKEHPMPHTVVSRKRALVRAPVAALALAAAALHGGWSTATAQELPQARQVAGVQTSGSRPLAELEEAFWTCDHAAARQGILDASTGTQCGVATEDLRLQKFNGDFRAMLSWWQRNKAREHRALDDAYRAVRLR